MNVYVLIGTVALAIVAVAWAYRAGRGSGELHGFIQARQQLEKEYKERLRHARFNLAKMYDLPDIVNDYFSVRDPDAWQTGDTEADTTARMERQGDKSNRPGTDPGVLHNGK